MVGLGGEPEDRLQLDRDPPLGLDVERRQQHLGDPRAPPPRPASPAEAVEALDRQASAADVRQPDRLDGGVLVVEGHHVAAAVVLEAERQQPLGEVRRLVEARERPEVRDPVEPGEQGQRPRSGAGRTRRARAARRRLPAGSRTARDRSRRRAASRRRGRGPRGRSGRGSRPRARPSSGRRPA